MNICDVIATLLNKKDTLFFFPCFLIYRPSGTNYRIQRCFKVAEPRSLNKRKSFHLTIPSAHFVPGATRPKSLEL